MNKRHFLQVLSLPVLAVGVPALRAQSIDATAVARHYAVLVHASYEDALSGALEIQKAVQALTTQPSQATLDAARKAWLAAREWYGQTEAFRFYGGPIDDEKGPEGRLNAWPMDESYVDYVKGRAQAGLINDRKVLITKANIARYNTRGGEENIAAGWHAIEFLLWGQDFDPDGPGTRPFDDYVDGKTANADRRRQYLTTVTELMVDDLRYLVGAWVPNTRNYRERFERGDMESIRKIIVGLGSLSRGELAGERMEVALNSQDQEDEHSCFSDNTHRDIVNNALGIENVWLGRYLRRDGSTLQGTSLRDLVAAKAPDIADRTTQRMAGSVAAARLIQAPFDREIVGGRDAPGRLRIQKTIDSLVAQSKDLTDAATALGITRLTLGKAA
ncbi:MAG: imelysin family protein [Pseudomonadota bacterium]|nr:imelysin family protein [Pseudomonadota bacterium]